VKIWLLESIFLCCWLAILVGVRSEFGQWVAIGVGCAAAILMYAVKCERCHRPEFALGQKPPRTMVSLFYPPKTCPSCELERI
jgi:hypothetical protein